MNQLRLKAGFDLAQFHAATGLAESSLQPGLAICLEQGLLSRQQTHYTCTERGWDLLDLVLEKFID
nr:hypothetical protein [Methylomonas koyamae]